MEGIGPIDFDINFSTHNNCGWYIFAVFQLYGLGHLIIFLIKQQI